MLTLQHSLPHSPLSLITTTTNITKHKMAATSSQVPDSASWSSLGSRFNIDGGRPPTLPAHYWPIETYVLPKIKALLNTNASQPVKVLILAGGTGAELELLMEGLEREGVEKGKVKVTQSDAAQGMLGVAEELVNKRGWADVVECRVLDAHVSWAGRCATRLSRGAAS